MPGWLCPDCSSTWNVLHLPCVFYGRSVFPDSAQAVALLPLSCFLLWGSELFPEPPEHMDLLHSETHLCTEFGSGQSVFPRGSIVSSGGRNLLLLLNPWDSALALTIIIIAVLIITANTSLCARQFSRPFIYFNSLILTRTLRTQYSYYIYLLEETEPKCEGLVNAPRLVVSTQLESRST